jgi:hypothetical protein
VRTVVVLCIHECNFPTASTAEGNNGGAIPTFHHTPSWRGVLIKHTMKLAFLYWPILSFMVTWVLLLVLMAAMCFVRGENGVFA